MIWEALIWMALLMAPLGSLLLSRRWSFFGDALGHASLAGIGLVVVLGFQSTLAVAVGAVLAGLTLGGLTDLFEKFGRLPGTIALTTSYLGLFAMGLFLLGSPGLHLESVLVGDLGRLNEETLWFMRIWTPLVWTLLLWKWKRIWLVVVDPSFARGLGVRVRLWEFVLLTVTCVSVVILMRAVGVVLVGALLILPTATAFLFSRGLKSQVGFSVVFALLGGILGWFVSSDRGVPVGPSIGFSSFLILLVVLVLSRSWSRSG